MQERQRLPGKFPRPCRAACAGGRRAGLGSSPTSGGGEAVQQQGGHVTWYRAPEYPVLVLLHSWCAGTVRDYISAELGVLLEEW